MQSFQLNLKLFGLRYMNIDFYNTRNILNVVNEEKIQIVEKGFLEQEQVECPVVHRFGPGIYIREVTLPAGIFSIGHKQKTTHLNVMLTGKVTMILEDGSSVDLEAPYTYVSKPGRKIGYIHETVIWQNIYATDETDIEKLEEMFLEKSITWQEHQKAQNLLLTIDYTTDTEDYLDAISEYGFDEKTVREQTENTLDQISMPFGHYKFTIGNSKIQGKGVLCCGNIEEEEIIGPARIEGMRTPLGRFTNHSKNPNAKMVLRNNGDVDLVALKKITGYKGGQLGEEITVDYRQVLQLSLGELKCQA
jgi:hypothetical protein